MNELSVNELIVKEALTWVGTPYQHRGRTKKGCDCTGLLLGVCNSLDNNVFGNYLRSHPVRNYPIDWNLHDMADDHIIKELLVITNPVSRSQTIPGDILVFHWGRCESHIGIMVNNFSFVHTYKKAGCQLARLLNSPFSKYWTKTFRIDLNKIKEFENSK